MAPPPMAGSAKALTAPSRTTPPLCGSAGAVCWPRGRAAQVREPPMGSETKKQKAEWTLAYKPQRARRRQGSREHVVRT
jgi:hypothetical protein